MPFKDPERERARLRSPKERAQNRLRSSAFARRASALRRVFRTIAPERLEALRAMFTAEERKAFDDFVFRSMSGSVEDDGPSR